MHNKSGISETFYEDSVNAFLVISRVPHGSKVLTMKVLNDGKPIELRLGKEKVTRLAEFLNRGTLNL